MRDHSIHERVQAQVKDIFLDSVSDEEHRPSFLWRFVWFWRHLGYGVMYGLNCLRLMLAFACRELYKWWAQYLHSQGDLRAAISYYEKADDILALTKIYCSLNNATKA